MGYITLVISQLLLILEKSDKIITERSPNPDLCRVIDDFLKSKKKYEFLLGR